MAVCFSSEVKARKGGIELIRFWRDDEGRTVRLSAVGETLAEAQVKLDVEEKAKGLFCTVRKDG